MPMPKNNAGLCEGASTPVYCPSIRTLGGGFGFAEADPPDPLATIEIKSCSTCPSIFIYPTAGTGHTVPVRDGTGIIGYAVNKSDCAPDCGCK
jgi:hypothetical protein